MKKIIFTLLMALMSSSIVMADDYVVIFKESKVFDEPNASGYVTKNQNDEEVTVKSGMAFKIVDKKTGWDMIEYSPGLRAMLMQNVAAAADVLKEPKAGDYTLANNNKEMVSVSYANGVWTLGSKGINYNGKIFGKVVIFFDKAGSQSFSLVNLDGKTIVYSYDNNLTHFF